MYEAANKPIVLFGTSTCPYCKATRKLLAANKVEYKDYLIDKSKSAEAEFKKLGGSGVPMIFIGNRKIVGFNKVVIEESLASTLSKNECDAIRACDLALN